MEEPFVEAAVAEAVKGPAKERVDQIARSIRREPLKFIGIAALMGFMLALAVTRDPRSDHE